MAGGSSVLMFCWCGPCVFGLGHPEDPCLCLIFGYSVDLGHPCPPVGEVVDIARGVSMLVECWCGFCVFG